MLGRYSLLHRCAVLATFYFYIYAALLLLFLFYMCILWCLILFVTCMTWITENPFDGWNLKYMI